MTVRYMQVFCKQRECLDESWKEVTIISHEKEQAFGGSLEVT